MPVPVSVMIFTLNEEVNLPHCLGSLQEFDDLIIVDSFSTDHTQQIARDAGARFFQHEFTGFGDQRNWALAHTAPRYEWVLILDADERLTPELTAEIANCVGEAADTVAGFRVKRMFYMWGKWLRHSSLYPNWVVRLVRRDRVRYINRGHAETQEVGGTLGELQEALIDENHKGLDDWWRRQATYAEREAEYENDNQGQFSLAGLASRDPLERRRSLKQLSWLLPLRGFFYFLYSYVVRLGMLDGREGYRFCRMKARYQQMIVENKRRLRKRAVAA